MAGKDEWGGNERTDYNLSNFEFKGLIKPVEMVLIGQHL